MPRLAAAAAAPMPRPAAVAAAAAAFVDAVSRAMGIADPPSSAPHAVSVWNLTYPLLENPRRLSSSSRGGCLGVAAT